jgi:S-adenosylmethionine hydrolase
MSIIANPHRAIFVSSQILLLICFSYLTACATCPCANRRGSLNDSHPAKTPMPALVIMTDFGVKDGAISAMKGVAYATAPGLYVTDLTHEVKPFNIWEGAFRLMQTFKYWPSGTVFVTVVDPGVGSERKSIIARSKSGHYFVGPDNGLLTLVDEQSGIESVREIDESKQRLKGSEDSNTFHGRDLYVYVGARLASGQLKMEDAGPAMTKPLVKIPYQHAEFAEGVIHGIIPVLDPQYGNVWTNVPKNLVTANFKNEKRLHIVIRHSDKVVYHANLPLVETFAAVPIDKPLLYFNSLLNLSVALDQGDFAAKYGISSGPDWTVELTAAK